MQQITAYRSNSGKTYDAPVEALTDDLRTYLSTISENEAIGAKLTDKIIASDFEPLCTILTELRSAFEAIKAPQLPIVEKHYYTTDDVPRSKALIRCLGGSRCDHPKGVCTADKAYQAELKAMAIYKQENPNGIWEVLNTRERNEWMQKAQEA